MASIVMSLMRAWVRAVSTHSSTHSSRRSVTDVALAALAAGELAEVGHQRGQLVDLGDHVVGDLAQVLVAELWARG